MLKRKTTRQEPPTKDSVEFRRRQSIEQLHTSIAHLRSRKLALEQQLAGVDPRYILSQETIEAQAELADNRELLALEEEELAELERCEAEARAKAGRDAYEALHLQFTALDDQAKACEMVTRQLAEQRAKLAEDARARLAEWPSHLHDILQQHVPVEDDVSRLVSAVLSYRKAIVACPEALSDSRLFDIWTALTDSPGEVLHGKYSDVLTTELEDWLTRYRQRAI